MKSGVNNASKKLKLWKKILIAVLSLLSLAIIVFFVWASQVSNAEKVKLQAFYDQNANLVVINEYPSYWEISPKTNDCTDDSCLKTLGTGVIFYPGAKIDSRAYFYKLDFLTNGKPFKTKLFITKPPLRLAFFGINQADEIIKKNPDIKNWTIGGHSLGGAMSCEYAKSHTEKITELLLMGAYCGSSLHDTNLKVISIHGSLDGVLTPQKVAENKKNLPDSVKDFIISGMNHAQVGNYGDQSGDKPATKSDEEVKMEIVGILKNEF
jgi:hypothetical protein